MNHLWRDISLHIGQVLGQTFVVQEHRPVGGGSINSTYVLTGEEHRYFVKLNQAQCLPAFTAEVLGLNHIAQTAAIRVPQPLCTGTIGDYSYLVMEWLPLNGRGDWAELGRQLARLHQQGRSDQFGWFENNTIGSTPQLNPWTADWCTFFSQHRIAYQLQLAQRQGGHFPRGQELLQSIPHLLSEHQPFPSLVHGDLWSGNAGFTASGEPVIFDPAAYFGDREVDLAMTELFGGFPPQFYQGYEEIFPLNAGYPKRKILYNLYHILNHFNLFGSSYAAQANRMIEKILRA